MNVLYLVLMIGLAAASAARYVVHDDVFAPLRAWTNAHMADNFATKLAYKLTHCTRCLGFWTTLLVASIWFWATDWPNIGESVVFILAGTGAAAVAEKIMGIGDE